MAKALFVEELQSISQIFFSKLSIKPIEKFIQLSRSIATKIIYIELKSNWTI